MRKKTVLNMPWLIALLLLSLSCVNTTSPSSEGVNNITAEELNTFLEAGEGLLVDVRTQSEYDEGHIANAQLINYYSEDFTEQICKLSKEKDIYLYCRSGNRSGKAANILVANGYTKVYNLIGGYSSYK